MKEKWGHPWAYPQKGSGFKPKIRIKKITKFNKAQEEISNAFAHMAVVVLGLFSNNLQGIFKSSTAFSSYFINCRSETLS